MNHRVNYSHYKINKFMIVIELMPSFCGRILAARKRQFDSFWCLRCKYKVIGCVMWAIKQPQFIVKPPHQLMLQEVRQSNKPWSLIIQITKTSRLNDNKGRIEAWILATFELGWNSNINSCVIWIITTTIYCKHITSMMLQEVR